MRKLVKDALNVDELAYSLEHIIGVDDNKKPEEYTDKEIVAEAEYQLSKYYEAATTSNDMLVGNETPEAQKTAEREVRQLNRFIKKWKAKVNRFDYRTPLLGGNGFEENGEVILRRTDDITIQKESESIDHKAEDIHTIKVQGDTVLCLLQFKDRPVEKTTMFTTQSEAPALSGLYNEFKADQIRDSLKRIGLV